MAEPQRPNAAAAFAVGSIAGAGAAVLATTYMRASSHSQPRLSKHAAGNPGSSLATSAWQRLMGMLCASSSKPSTPTVPCDFMQAAAEARAARSTPVTMVQSEAQPPELLRRAQNIAAAVPAVAPAEEGEEDEILAEHFTRNTQFFGAAAQHKVTRSFVVVVGLGGVGSHAAAMLLRSGVRRLRLIDFDQVTLSSLNRHAVATRADVGLPKATVLARHFRQIVPEADVEARVEMYTAEAAEALLAGQPDFVLDAIDNIDTKVALLAACKHQGIPVLACAGAGAKADPTRLRVCDVAESSADPLARAVRHRLRATHGIDSGIPVLLSTEKPRCRLVDNTGGGNLSDFQVVPNFRVRTIPVLGTTPAMFGQAAAAHILCQLAGQPFSPEPVFSILPAAMEAQLQRLREREEVRFGTADGVLVDGPEVAVLVREVWRGMSARALAAGEGPPRDKGLNRRVGGLALTRWDASRPADVDNLVLLTFEEAEAHEAHAADAAGLRERDPAFAAFVEAKLDRAAREFFQ